MTLLRTKCDAPSDGTRRHGVHRPRSFHGVSNKPRKVATGQVGGAARPSLASPRRLGHLDHSRPHLPFRTPIRTRRGFAGRLVELCTEGTCRSGGALCAIASPPFAAGLEHAWQHTAPLCHPLHGSSPCVGISSPEHGSKLLTAAALAYLFLSSFKKSVCESGGSPFRLKARRSVRQRLG